MPANTMKRVRLVTSILPFLGRPGSLTPSANHRPEKDPRVLVALEPLDAFSHRPELCATMANARRRSRANSSRASESERKYGVSLGGSGSRVPPLQHLKAVFPRPAGMPGEYNRLAAWVTLLTHDVAPGWDPAGRPEGPGSRRPGSRPGGGAGRRLRRRRCRGPSLERSAERSGPRRPARPGSS